MDSAQALTLDEIEANGYHLKMTATLILKMLSILRGAYPGAPNGRIDLDDDFRCKTNEIGESFNNFLWVRATFLCKGE